MKSILFASLLLASTAGFAATSTEEVTLECTAQDPEEGSTITVVSDSEGNPIRFEVGHDMVGTLKFEPVKLVILSRPGAPQTYTYRGDKESIVLEYSSTTSPRNGLRRGKVTTTSEGVEREFELLCKRP